MDKISAQGCGVFLGILAAGMALGVFSVPALALVAALLAALALLVSFWGIWESRRTRKGVVFAAAGVILSLASLGAIGAALLSNAAGVKTPQDSAQLNAPQTRRQSPPATHAIAPPPLPKEPGEPAKPSSTNKPVEPDARVTPPENGTATPTPSTAPEETTSADGMLRSVDMGQPQEQPPSQAERLSERISALSAESASLPEAELWTKASALRADIRALGNDVNTTAPLDTQLDKVIADKLERKAEEPLAQAQQTYNGGELEKSHRGSPPSIRGVSSAGCAAACKSPIPAIQGMEPSADDRKNRPGAHGNGR